MRWIFLTLTAILMISGCYWQPSNYQTTDFILYGVNERHTVFYGKLETAQSRDLKLGDATITLRGNAPRGPFVVPGTLEVNGSGSLLTKPQTSREALALATIPFSSDLSVLSRQKLEGVVYFNGQQWFTVGSSGELQADSKVKLAARQRQGLRFFGEITDAEADALQAYLETKFKKQPMAIALLDPMNIPDSPLPLEPRPDRNKTLAMYVQIGVPVDLVGGFANNESLTVQQLLSGSNATYGETTTLIRWDASDSSFAKTWALMNGNQIPAPSRPNVDFSRSSVISAFLGQRSTGGYLISIVSAKLEGSTLTVRANVAEPAPGRLTTQVITSPFSSIIVSGSKFGRVVVVNNASGATIAQLSSPSQ
jgi:PrcB C-terminal